MCSETTQGRWDFTPVIDLIKALYPTIETTSHADSGLIGDLNPPSTSGVSAEDRDSYSGLGNFDNLWRYLGQPLTKNLSHHESLEEIGSIRASTKESLNNNKVVRWRDEIEGAGLTYNDDSQNTSKLKNSWDNKYQRNSRRENRKVLPSGSENDSELDEINIVEDSTKKYILELISNKGAGGRDAIEERIVSENGNNQNTTKLRKSRGNQHRRNLELERISQRKPDVKVLSIGSENDSELDSHRKMRSQDRKAIIQDILHITPPKFETPVKSASTIVKRPQSLSDQEVGLIVKPRSLSGTLAALILPEQTAYATVAEQKARLTKKLSTKFVEEKQFLGASKVPAYGSKSDSLKESGIHVFVDASNILIGFHDALKISRGISSKSRIRRQPLSFRNLSLILERGRPTAKQVLVGSDNFPAVQEAKAIGYETNILERVHKAKELTPRQKKYSYHNSKNKQTGQSSGSETAAGIYAPEKWVEQAVDEILHLKILESIVDAVAPSTIVLATGDAAEAEYSQGFLKMVERALEKGWMVELASFRHNTSQAYRRKDFRNKWGTRFRTVELDEFVEELLEV